MNHYMKRQQTNRKQSLFLEFVKRKQISCSDNDAKTFCRCSVQPTVTFHVVTYRSQAVWDQQVQIKLQTL